MNSGQIEKRVELPERRYLHEHKNESRRIGRLMRQNGLVCKTIKKFKVTTNSNHNRMLSPNLLNRQFKVDEPNQVGGRYHLHLDAERLVVFSHGH